MSWENILKEEIDSQLATRLRILKDALPSMIMSLEQISQDYRNRKSFNTQKQRDFIGQNCYVIKDRLEQLLKDLDGFQ